MPSIEHRTCPAVSNDDRARRALGVHADFEPHLAGFYQGSGFGPTEAGLMKLGE